MFIDLHTHSEKMIAPHESVYNIIIPGHGEISSGDLDLSRSMSVGIHPWYINEESIDKQLMLLKGLARLPAIKMLGECGLDRLRGPGLDLQHRVLEEHLRLAEDLKKPIIIHCVKCHSDLIAVKKRLNPSVPMIVHGYNNNREILLELIRHQFYFSFGAAVLNESSNAFKLISIVPDSQLFLETSDKEVGIDLIYQAAAKIKNIPVNNLEDIIFANWMSLTEGSSMLL